MKEIVTLRDPMLDKQKKGATRSNGSSYAVFILCILALVCFAALVEIKRVASINDMISSSNNTIRSYKPLLTHGNFTTETVHRKAHIVLAENRDLQTEKSYGYYTFAMWKLYTKFHSQDTTLLVYNSSNLCISGKNGDGAEQQNCAGYNGTRMSPYWMKVLAVRKAMEEANENDICIFMDSDSQILNANFTLNIFDMAEVQSFLESGKQMLVIDERSDSHWDTVLHQEDMKPGYEAPIVSNLFMVINNKVGREMMEMWWRSMQHTTLWEHITNTSMLFHWPWEQERVAAFYNSTPHLFYPVQQSWQYFGFLHHGPLCCIGFHSKFDIIRSLNETLMNQTRALPKLANIYNGTTYEELVSNLYRQIKVKYLTGIDETRMTHELQDFWKIWERKK